MSDPLKVVTVRVTDSERKMLKNNAANAGVSLNRYVRLCLAIPELAGAPVSSESTERGKTLSKVFAVENSG